MKVRFEDTFQQALRARVSFGASTRFAQRFHRYGVPVLSIIVFLLLQKLTHPFRSEITFNGQSYPRIAIAIAMVILIPFSVLCGWLSWLGIKSGARESIQRAMEKWPRESFGAKTVEMNNAWLSIETPVIQARYSWLLVDQIWEKEGFIFVAAGGRLLTSIPMNAFRSQGEKDDFVKSCNELLESSRLKGSERGAGANAGERHGA